MARKSFFSTPRTKGKPKADLDVQQSSEELEEAAETAEEAATAGPRDEIAEIGDGDGGVGGNAQTTELATELASEERSARSSKWNPFS